MAKVIITKRDFYCNNSSGGMGTLAKYCDKQCKMCGLIVSIRQKETARQLESKQLIEKSNPASADN